MFLTWPFSSGLCLQIRIQTPLVLSNPPHCFSFSYNILVFLSSIREPSLRGGKVPLFYVFFVPVASPFLRYNFYLFMWLFKVSLSSGSLDYLLHMWEKTLALCFIRPSAWFEYSACHRAELKKYFLNNWTLLILREMGFRFWWSLKVHLKKMYSFIYLFLLRGKFTLYIA